MSDSGGSQSGTPSVLLLGIGNVLWADEGFGVRVIETLHERYEFPDHVVVMDGGTQGLYLIQHVQAADILVVFDAIDYHLAPGTMRLIRDEDVPAYLGAKKMSLHQTGFQEVLSMAQLLGDYPSHILLVGVQPLELEDYGGSLREPVKRQIEPAIDAAIAYLAEFDIFAAPRTQALGPDEVVHPAQLAMDLYETQRPDETDACRVGDARVLVDTSISFAPNDHSLGANTISVNVDSRRQD